MSTRQTPRRTRAFKRAHMTLALLGLALTACGIDTEGIFQAESSGTTGTGSSSATTGSGGAAGSGGQTAGSGGAAGGAAGSGGTGGASLPEDCLDGVDNDDDGDVDCADADCGVAGFSCEAAPPDGWSYTWTTQGPSPAPAPCADGSTPESLVTGPAGPAECTPCTCGDLAGAACSPPQLSCFPGQTGCGGNAQDWSGVFANGACQKPTNLLGANLLLSCRQNGQAMVTAAGSCPASPTDFSNKAPFQGALDACPAKSGGGCAAGSACVAKNPDPAQSLCIRKDGKDACPAGFATTIDAFTGGTDARSCSACACEPATTCEGGTFTFFDNNACAAPGAGNSANIDVDSATCRNVSGQLDAGSWSVQANPPTAGGACKPTGGQPMGQVDTQGAVTFCCK